MMTERKREGENLSPLTEEDWREVPRSEMFRRVIIAVDCSRGDAEAHGDKSWMRYCDEQLFPFLDSVRDRAEEEEEGH